MLIPLPEFAKQQKPSYRVTSWEGHNGKTMWDFFTCSGAKTWRDGELKGKGTIKRLLPDKPICE